MPGLPAKLNDHLRGHWQLVSRRYLLGPGGYRPGQLDGWLRRGHLIEVHRGVYGVPCAPLSYERTVYAAVLRAGASARAGPHASLVLRDVTGFGGSTVDVVVPTARRVSNVEFGVRRLSLPRVDCARIAGIPALSAIRALIEVADGLDHQVLRVAFDDIRRRGLGTLPHAMRRAEALTAHRGARILRELLRQGAVPHESEAERLLLAPFLRELFPQERLEWQVTDLVPGRRLDATIRRLRLGFEYDGKSHHLLPTDRDGDELRRLEVRLHGIEIVALTHGMLTAHRDETRRSILSLAAQREQDI